MVWVVRYDDIPGGDKTTTIWDDVDAARKDVCSCIIDDINNNGWDFNDQYAYDIAKQIQDSVQLGSYDLAIDLWNDWASNSGSDIYWSVEQEDLCTSAQAGTPGTIAFPVKTDDPPDTQPSPFAANTPGATCRGHCGQWNEYAYADKSDGTFLCFQCKTLGAVFGSKIT